jgi:magnesium-transporting ATPase (P-type)
VTSFSWRPADLVPADGTLAPAKDLFLNEAPLTGESLPVEKHGAARVLRGTSVVSGLGVASVEATGPATEFGRIAAHLVVRPRPSSSAGPGDSDS